MSGDPDLDCVPLADKAFDVNWLPKALHARGTTAVIAPQPNRMHQRDDDADADNWRHLLENWLAKIGEFRGIATRSAKTDCGRSASRNLSTALIAAR